MINIQDIVLCEKIIDELPAGLLVIDPDGVVVKSNFAASRIFGLPLSKIMGRGWGELFIGRQENDQFNQVIVDVIQEETHSVAREVWYTTDSSQKMRLNIQSSYVRHSGNLVGILVLVNDVTELHRARESERKLLRERAKQQTERIESLVLLSQSIAHQVRNPVSVIGGFARRLDHIVDKHGLGSEYPSIILEQASRLEKVVSGVIRLASSHRNFVSIAETRNIIDQAVSDIAAFAASQGKSLRTTIEIDKPTICADSVLLKEAIYEVLANSVDFTPTAEVCIKIVIDTDGDCTRISISDKGVGIQNDLLPYVFDPFFTSKSMGVGIGLTITRQIMQEHGGRALAMNSLDGTGTVVELLFPESTLDTSASFQEPGDDYTL